jgi:hypothetical protein
MLKNNETNQLIALRSGKLAPFLLHLSATKRSAWLFGICLLATLQGCILGPDIETDAADRLQAPAIVQDSLDPPAGGMTTFDPACTRYVFKVGQVNEPNLEDHTHVRWFVDFEPEDFDPEDPDNIAFRPDQSRTITGPASSERRTSREVLEFILDMGNLPKDPGATHTVLVVVADRAFKWLGGFDLYDERQETAEEGEGQFDMWQWTIDFAEGGIPCE